MSHPFKGMSLPARVLFAAVLSSAPLWVSACASGGGGSGGGVQPLPPAPPPPLPPPPPPPPPPPAGPPAASFETSEYNFTRGLGVIKASSAYSRGATGEGIIVAVIDTGAIQDHPDLDGQFTGPTFDVNAAGRSPGDIDTEGHGSLVSGIIAAKRDNSGIMGVAFGATILDIRADRPGTCAEPEDCRLPATDVARAINYAVTNGAKVINLSLGLEPGNSQTIENAIIAAAQSGVLVVVSAGNDAEPPTTDEFGNVTPAKGTSPNSPARAAGYSNNLGRVVAVGSVIARDDPATPENDIGLLSAFSNRAGSQARDSYILAPGQGVVSSGPDDNVAFPGDATNDADNIGDYYRISGTSFAAPYVSGALALLLQTFPNLQSRPQDALSILLGTADDYVDPNPDPVLGIAAGTGTDNVSGVGLLNLQRAFEPQGIPTASINAERVPLNLLAGTAGGAFGDWAEAGGLYDGISLIDSYDRTFDFDAASLARPSEAPLTGLDARALSFAGESRAIRAGSLDLSWHTPKLHLDRTAPYQPEPQSQFTANFRFAGGEVSTGRGGSLPRIAPAAHLVAEPGAPDAFSLTGSWASVTQDIGAVDVHAFAASDDGLSRYGAGLSRSGASWDLRTGIEAVEDETSALGGAVQSRLGTGDQGRLTAWMTEGRKDLGGGWHLSGGYERGLVELGGISARSVQTSRWSIGAEREIGDGAISLVVAQPRRAETGSLTFTAVTGADTEGLIVSERQIALTPSGRQMNFETRLRWQLGEDWTAESAAALITEPNHVASADAASMVWFGLKGRF